MKNIMKNIVISVITVVTMAMLTFTLMYAGSELGNRYRKGKIHNVQETVQYMADTTVDYVLFNVENTMEFVRNIGK